VSAIEQQPAPVLLAADKLSAGYGAIKVVRDLDLEVRPGEVVALLGPNGAGKTTTLMTLAGAIPPLGGNVMWLGAPSKAPLHRRARSGLGFLTEARSVIMSLSTRDNLRLAGVDAEYALSLFPELRSRMKVPAGLISGGEQQMLSLARMLARKPRVVLADELSLGLAPMIVRRLLDALRLAADGGVGVLLVEQHIQQALTIADRGYVMRRGEIEISGPASELRGRLDEIEATYMAARNARIAGNGAPER
jgi:ABC-type branched-subunit amino acid transport system ATPase component